MLIGFLRWGVQFLQRCDGLRLRFVISRFGDWDMWDWLFGKSRRKKSFKEKLQEDKDFVKALVKIGFISEEFGRDALKKQEYAEIKKQHVRVVDILFKMGTITRVQAELAFDKIGKHYRFCPQCLQRHSLKHIREGKHIVCAKCRNVFEVTDNVLKLDTKILEQARDLVIRPQEPTEEEPPPEK